MLLTLKKKQKKMTSEENQITVITPSAAESSEALPEKEKVPASVPSEFEFGQLSG